MKKDIRDILDYDIIPDCGIGDIRFGMTMDNFSELYDIEKDTLKIPLDGIKEYNAYYMFDNSICLDFDKNKKLHSIALSRNFQGKLNGKIGIGSYIGELRALRKDVGVYEGDNGLILGTGYRFRIMPDEEELEVQYIDGVKHEDCIPDYPNFAQGAIDHYRIEDIFMESWDRTKPTSCINWCYYLENWIEPEEKYLEIRYT